MTLEEKIIQCAAEAYAAEADTINLNTVIREELSNKSLMLIAFISTIEEAVGVSIDLREAGDLRTIGDFVEKVKALQG